jgi:fructose-bisphosphate aldolase, class I
MAMNDLRSTASELVADGKGLLAVDETVAAITKRLDAYKIESTPDSRRAYREMFFTTPAVAAFISGVILHDETIRQKGPNGIAMSDLLARQGIIPGIKVDDGVRRLAGSARELITEGLDGLAGRLKEYWAFGARFAKWRAVFAVSETLPSEACIRANVHALARYAAICQEHNVLPIVEADVLMDGSHTIERCEQVTGRVLCALFAELRDQQVALEGLLLKTNMVIAGRRSLRQDSLDDVAAATLRCLRRHVPAAVPGVVFLSGGQHYRVAAMHLSAINQAAGPRPWKLTFSYGRALQDEALEAWRGRADCVAPAQLAFYHRAKCNGAAAMGRYTTSMEGEWAVA